VRSYISLIEFKEMWSDILLIVYIEIWLYTSIEYSFCFHSCLPRCFYGKMMTQIVFFLSYSVNFSFIVYSVKDSNQNVFFSLNDIFFIELLFCFGFHSYYSFILVLNTIDRESSFRGIYNLPYLPSIYSFYVRFKSSFEW